MKTAVIKNEYDGPLGQLDKFDQKYLRFLENEKPTGIQESVFEALKSRDLG
jgi:hypothetical protein